mmetsp:Transcript_137768/g.384152  ORF Transcript_137768/g.384152 Transcript_137768/m.384152 type:complete len:129 (-) Transcript_137768:189-575(-)
MPQPCAAVCLTAIAQPSCQRSLTGFVVCLKISARSTAVPTRTRSWQVLTRDEVISGIRKERLLGHRGIYSVLMAQGHFEIPRSLVFGVLKSSTVQRANLPRLCGELVHPHLVGVEDQCRQLTTTPGSM